MSETTAFQPISTASIVPEATLTTVSTFQRPFVIVLTGAQPFCGFTFVEVEFLAPFAAFASVEVIQASVQASLIHGSALTLTFWADTDAHSTLEEAYTAPAFSVLNGDEQAGVAAAWVLPNVGGSREVVLGARGELTNYHFTLTGAPSKSRAPSAIIRGNVTLHCSGVRALNAYRFGTTGPTPPPAEPSTSAATTSRQQG